MTDTVGLLEAALSHHQSGHLDKAEELYARVLKMAPEDPNALHLLGIVRRDSGDLSTATALIGRALAQEPHFPEALVSLATVYMRAGNPADAEVPLLKATTLDAGNADAWLLLASQKIAIGHLSAAKGFVERATDLAADSGRVTFLQALVLRATNDNAGAAKLLLRVLEELPDHVEALLAIGACYYDLRQFSEAERYLQRAIQLNPNHASALATVGNCRIELGDIVGAMKAFKASHDASPHNSAVSSSLLFYMAFEPDVTATKLFNAVTAWGEYVSASITPWAHAKPTIPPDRLRIGYLSHEFGTHVTSYFFEPVVARHDATRFEIVCFAANERSDETTEKLRGLSEGWHDVSGMSDGRIAQRIKEEDIHILVLVSSYRARHRVALAYKPAPVQVCYHNLVSSTGLGAIDYLITEELTDPTPQADRHYTENLVRLTNRNCYLPPENCPEVSTIPSDTNGYVTFGSYNNVAKITPKVFELWTRILDLVPQSRLRLKNVNGSSSSEDQTFLLSKFQERGLARERIDFLETIPARADHLAAYSDVDIALDTFPCNGGTTSCDAIWMGVPVVTRTGNTFMGRQGLNYLTKLGLEDLIAETDQDYIDIAVTLASTAERRRTLRSSLRATMKETMLNYDQHVEELEAAYEIMWARYAEGAEVAGFSVAKRGVTNRGDE